LKVTVTVRFAVMVTVHGFVLGGVSQPVQLPNDDVLMGLAVNVSVVLLTRKTHGAGLAQLRLPGEPDTVPEPFPAKVMVRAGEPLLPPLLVKQTTLPVM
jgi:hypothetical protein